MRAYILPVKMVEPARSSCPKARIDVSKAQGEQLKRYAPDNMAVFGGKRPQTRAPRAWYKW